MNKFQISCFFAMLLTAVFFLSCKKNDFLPSLDLPSVSKIDDLKQNEATWVSSDQKWWYIRLRFFIGHTADQCGNRCIYIMGEWGHADCRGFGNICKNVVKGRISQEEETEEYIFALTDAEALGEDLIYLFPDRSFLITNPLNNSDLWLNVPEQILIRESDSIPFIIHDIWFSEEQELENL